MASNFLIPDEEYRAFLDTGEFTDRRRITEFAESVGIAPCIVVGT
jgi:hypothetical protein